jgi:hypothetical protein
MKEQTACSISLRGVFCVASILAIATGTGTPARASTIQYTINNNAGLTAPLQNESVEIDGQFDYDSVTKGITNFGVKLTTHLEFSGTYTEVSSPVLVAGLGQPKITFGGEGDNGVFYTIDLFLNDFGSDTPSDIRFVEARSFTNHGYILLPMDAQHRPTITGIALVGREAAVPEPSTGMFALTGGVLTLFSLLRRRSCRKLLSVLIGDGRNPSPLGEARLLKSLEGDKISADCSRRV